MNNKDGRLKKRMDYVEEIWRGKEETIVDEVWEAMDESDEQSCASGIFPLWILDMGLSDKGLEILKERSKGEIIK